MVTSGLDLVVIEQLTGVDITRRVLLRVVAAFEQGSAGVLSREFLLQVIRSQEADSPRVVASYLEQSLNLFRGDDGAGSAQSETQELRYGAARR
jgi:polyhydroxyalkanoate synthesis regulator protein